uniref:F-box domain-containing protein n=1 Tax=Stomoxys calcitrans TaxID=35570 RepID=A0A1I8Q8V0_STOCA
MPKSKFNVESSEEESQIVPRKKPRLTTKGLRSSRRVKQKQLAPAPPTVVDLPPEILEKIIGNVDIWHHNRIRETSRRFREISDLYICHEFEKSLYKNVSTNPQSYESAVLLGIRHATNVYVRSGFKSLFCGCLLPMLRDSYKNPFCPPIEKVTTFLVHFYSMVEDAVDGPASQKSRLLYVITLLRLFKAFRAKYTIVSNSSLPRHWRAVIELEGSWMGMLWHSKANALDLSNKRRNLLVILTELLIASISDKSFKRVWDCPSELYVFGNDTSGHKRAPRTVFTLTVYGTKTINSLFQTCLEEDDEQFTCPLQLPKGEFMVDLDITSREAMKWGCPKTRHMTFSPFDQLISSGEEEGYE